METAAPPRAFPDDRPLAQPPGRPHRRARDTSRETRRWLPPRPFSWYYASATYAVHAYSRQGGHFRRGVLNSNRDRMALSGHPPPTWACERVPAPLACDPTRRVLPASIGLSRRAIRE